MINIIPYISTHILHRHVISHNLNIITHRCHRPSLPRLWQRRGTFRRLEAEFDVISKADQQDYPWELCVVQMWISDIFEKKMLVSSEI